jgi:Flagellin and related hook-associated proteins
MENQFLFAGTASDQPPFTIETDADGFVTSVTYNGNTNVTENEISDGSSLTIDVPGANTTGTGARGVITDSRSGADFFNHLISLQNNLRDGNISAIASVDRPALAKDEENLIYHIGNNGVTQSRLETAKSALLSRTDSLEKMISKQADADLTETLVKLTQSQTAFQAALQSGATLMRLSLMNYLS